MCTITSSDSISTYEELGRTPITTIALLAPVNRIGNRGGGTRRCCHASPRRDLRKP